MGRRYSEEDYNQREQLILNAAMKLFMEKDFSDITMRELARECGMANGTIFNYFETKEQLFRKLLYLQYQAYFQSEQARIQRDGFRDFAGYRRFILDGTKDLLENRKPLVALLGLHHNVFGLANEADPLRDLSLSVYQNLNEVARQTHARFPALSEIDAVRVYFFLSSILVGYRNLFRSPFRPFREINLDPIRQLTPKADLILSMERYLDGLEKAIS